MKNLSEKIESVRNQQQLVKFITELANDYSKTPSHWNNRDLPSFLDALAAWVEDMDAYYENNNLPYDEKDISWKNIADMLYAATKYE